MQITSQIDVLRAALADQERALQQQLSVCSAVSPVREGLQQDLVRSKEAELDAQHEDLERRRGRLVSMYREVFSIVAHSESE